MCDGGILLELLNQTLDAAETVLKRFIPVKSVDYFTDTQGGKEKLDAICMVIIGIGESLKKIDKITDKKLLDRYPQVDWKGAKGMRDIISHHYFDIDAEEIFWVCENKMKPLAETLSNIIEDVSRSRGK